MRLNALLKTMIAVCFISMPVAAETADLPEPNSVIIEDAKAYAPLGAGMVSAGYLTLAHTDPRHGYALVAASSPLFERVELHTHLLEEGVMRMRKLERIEIPVGKAVTLKPGGLHLMLMGANAPIIVGSQIPVTLVFHHESHGELTRTIMLPVVAR